MCVCQKMTKHRRSMRAAHDLNLPSYLERGQAGDVISRTLGFQTLFHGQLLGADTCVLPSSRWMDDMYFLFTLDGCPHHAGCVEAIPIFSLSKAAEMCGYIRTAYICMRVCMASLAKCQPASHANSIRAMCTHTHTHTYTHTHAHTRAHAHTQYTHALSLSLYLSIYLSIYPSIYLSLSPTSHTYPQGRKQAHTHLHAFTHIKKRACAGN